MLKEVEEAILEKELLFELNNSGENLATLLHAQAHYQIQLGHEEAFWKQKSRLKWLKEGNGNTKVFYVSVWQTQRKLHIHSISNIDGTLLDNEEYIKPAAVQYFQNQLQAEGQGDDSLLDVIPRLISLNGMRNLSLLLLWMKLNILCSS